MNSRKVNQMMKRMGIQQQEIDAEEVIIITSDEKIIIENPSVSKVNMMGQQTYQVVGEEKRVPLNVIEETEEEVVEISDDDVEMVVSQTNVSKEKAKETLELNKGDIAKTIMDLKED